MTTTSITPGTGDGKGKCGITNANSIGIEFVSIQTETTMLLFKMQLITKHLMSELNIPIDRVIRHYDASGRTALHP